VEGYLFKKLPAVPDELAAVIRDDKQTGVVPGNSYLNNEFTRELLQKSLRSKGRYPLVHIASHFHFEPGNDTQSFLLLGDGTPLRLSDVEKENNLFGGVDLLTLSACETALGGGKSATGKEVDGLSIMAQRQGAKAVLATLWPVADNSTAQLMSQFYKLRDDGKVSKGESLRQAQLSLLRGEVKPGDQPSGIRNFEVVLNEAKKNPDAPPFVPDPKKQYAHPYFWAPFILVGNWL
jgi:CHAT domain-containing protein